MNSIFTVETLHREPTLTMRTHTSVDRLPLFLGTAYGSVVSYLAAQGRHPAGPPFVLYHNMDLADLDVEAGFPLRRRVTGTDQLVAGEIAECKAATCTHVGSYETIGESYEMLAKWMEAKGFEGTGEAYEFYLNDPSETPPERLRTRIICPIKSGGDCDGE